MAAVDSSTTELEHSASESTTAPEPDPLAVLLDAFQRLSDEEKDMVTQIACHVANHNEDDPAPAATPEPPKGPVSREVVVSVCGELDEVVQLLRALHYLSRDTQNHDTDSAEAFALTAEHLSVRGIQMVESCVTELGERPAGNFEVSVFEERRLDEAAAKKREAACNAAEQ